MTFIYIGGAIFLIVLAIAWSAAEKDNTNNAPPYSSSNRASQQPTRDNFSQSFRYVMWGEKYRVDVVGESFYQDNLLSIVGKKGKTSVRLQKAAVIIHEPDNQYDGNAHAVIIDGKKVGHISKASSAKLVQEKRRLGISDCLIACPAIINGGWRDNSSEGNFGVKLDFPPIAKIGSVLSEKSLDDSLEKFESLKK